MQKLKTISDKNIINHKLEIDHPLIQLFDFHSGNIINMNFNSLENQHGIIVTMVFSINGYRFSQEAFINNNDNLGDVLFQRKASTNNITGSYLETLNNYLNMNILEFKGSWDLFNSFEKKCVPSCPGNFFFFETASRYVAQACLELLGLNHHSIM